MNHIYIPPAFWLLWVVGCLLLVVKEMLSHD